MDPGELRTLLQQHHYDCYGWALCCCRFDPHAAEDVLQAAYLKVLEGEAQFGGRSSFKTWVFAVIRRTARDERRKAFVRRLRFTNQESDLPGSEDPVGTTETGELQEGFRRALAMLPKRQRETLHLVFYQDLTIEEAAAVLNISVGSARTHYTRGKINIRKFMETRYALSGSKIRRNRDQGTLQQSEARRQTTLP